MWKRRKAGAGAVMLKLSAQTAQPDGWMAGGWGGYRFRFQNQSPFPVRLIRFEAHWEARGRPVGQPWSAQLDQIVAPGAELERNEIGFLPREIVDAALPGHPTMVGSFVAQRDGIEEALAFQLAIPAAQLPEPLELRHGRYVGLSLMRSRWASWANGGLALSWLDQAYQAMHELTGVSPHGGELLRLEESPPNPYFAYAGLPIVLNTRYVPSSMQEVDNGHMTFGWLHELGHVFDELGRWYNWNGAASEFQANFKLAYAFEHVSDPPWRIDWRGWRNPSYPHPTEGSVVDGRTFVDCLFTFNGDAYLADGARDWSSLGSDETQAFFQRIQRIYGWEAFRRWYRVYGRLQERGKQPPAAPEDKIALAAAILCRTSNADLLPVFRRWRFPVSEASVADMARRYRIED